MSRKGNRILEIPATVNVVVASTVVNIEGPKGKLSINYPNTLTIKVGDGKVAVTRANEIKQTRMMHGTINALIGNAIIGVSEGHMIKLHIEGVGYKSSISGNKFTLLIGFSHPVIFDIPQGINAVCKTPTDIEISGINKEVVGEFAANIRAVRKPEPYKGKGIMYLGEHIVRKVGKTAEGAKK